MAMESEEFRKLEKEMVGIAAESLATQTVVIELFRSLCRTIPGFDFHVLKAIDDAANKIEQLSVAAGTKAGHLPETLRIIEQLRAMLKGEDKPRREV